MNIITDIREKEGENSSAPMPLSSFVQSEWMNRFYSRVKNEIISCTCLAHVPLKMEICSNINHKVVDRRKYRENQSDAINLCFQFSLS